MNSTPGRNSQGNKNGTSKVASSASVKKVPAKMTGGKVPSKTAKTTVGTSAGTQTTVQHAVKNERPANYYVADRKTERTAPVFDFKLNRKNITLIVIAVLIIANIIAITGITQRKIPERLTPEQVANASKIDIEKMFESPFADAEVSSSDYKKGTLLLVNDEFSFDSRGFEEAENGTLIRVNTNIKDRNFKARDNTTHLNSVTVDALNLMFADFVTAGGKRDVMINEAYRSYEAQKSIYDAKVKSLGPEQTIAQKPGYSEHHTGYAVDFSIYPDGGRGARTFTREEDYLWIYENCHKYGFILRYPEDKTHITGISPESWHFRYVGVPHSNYIYEKGITLEEYLSEVKIYTENVPLIFTVDDTEYGVYYVECGDSSKTEFKVPKNTEYYISGDNSGGFVVWYKTQQ